MSHKTKAQRLRQRQNVKIWYPKANDLMLPDVPTAEDRAEVRQALAWLGKLPVRGGHCWQSSQAVTLLAQDPRVQYVEGVSWNVKQFRAGQYVPLFQHDGECPSVCSCKPLPHAWNSVSVNGHAYVVDLLAEFFNWRFGSEYLHEPLKVYSLEEMLNVGGVPGNFSLVQKVWMEEHQDHEPESMVAICQHVFREASDRLEKK
jgi:hypothetical protein